MAQSPNVYTIDISGLTETIGSLQQIASRADSWGTELERTIGLVLQAEVDEQFNSSPGVRQTSTTYFGTTWEALTDRYLKANPRREGGQQLCDSGELLQSLQVGGSGNILSSTGQSITFGSNLPKARGLQRKREFLVITDTMVSVTVAVIENFIATGQK